MTRRCFGGPCSIALLVALAAMASCGPAAPGGAGAPGTPAKAPAPATPVALQKLEVRAVQRDIAVTGTLWGDEDAVISSKVPGRIIAVYKDIGDTVVSSEPLAQIVTTDYVLVQRQKTLEVREALGKLGFKELPANDDDVLRTPGVERARLQAANAQARYERGKKLFEAEQPRISQQEFDDLKTGWEVARNEYEVASLAARSELNMARVRQAELDMAAQRLSDATIKAPAATGAAPSATTLNVSDAAPSAPAPVAATPKPRRYEVIGRMISQGEFVRDGMPTFRLVDRDRIKLRVMIPERYAAQVAVGQKVKVNVESRPDDFWGVVVRVNPQIDPANRMFQAEATLDNAEHKLMPGAFARARILTQSTPSALFVPLQAVLSFAGVDKVFVVREGKAQEIPLTLGQRQGDWIEATGPLTGEDSVIVHGHSKLATGMAVEVKPLENAKD